MLRDPTGQLQQACGEPADVCALRVGCLLSGNSLGRKRERLAVLTTETLRLVFCPIFFAVLATVVAVACRRLFSVRCTVRCSSFAFCYCASMGTGKC
jgi:hypothetical protein